MQATSHASVAGGGVPNSAMGAMDRMSRNADRCRCITAANSSSTVSLVTSVSLV